MQLSNLELSEFVDAELERNPLLEREDHGEAPAKDEPAREYSDDATADGSTAATTPRATTGSISARPPGEAAAALDTDSTNVFPDAAPADSRP